MDAYRRSERAQKRMAHQRVHRRICKIANVCACAKQTATGHTKACRTARMTGAQPGRAFPSPATLAIRISGVNSDRAGGSASSSSTSLHASHDDHSGPHQAFRCQGRIWQVPGAGGAASVGRGAVGLYDATRAWASECLPRLVATGPSSRRRRCPARPAAVSIHAASALCQPERGMHQLQCAQSLLDSIQLVGAERCAVGCLLAAGRWAQQILRGLHAGGCALLASVIRSSPTLRRFPSS